MTTVRHNIGLVFLFWTVLLTFVPLCIIIFPIQ